MKPGSKQTEVGVIPEEWEVKTFGEVFDYLPTATNSRSDLGDTGDIYYIHYGDIHTRFHNHLDFRTTQPPRIDRSLCRNAALLKNGDWVMADASEDYDGVGKTIEVQGLEENTNAIAGLHTFVLRERTPTFAPGFKGHLGNLESLHEQYLRVATGMKVYGVSKTALKGLELSIPPLPEQRAIATALSEVDALLAALDRLIAKQRDLKQAAMQQLLTGQTRLPGFTGEWEVKRLDELADIRSGGTPSTSVAHFWDGNIPWCTPTDITALNGHKYLGETNRMITRLGLKASSAEMIPAHSIVMTSRATIGECAINGIPVSTNQGFKNFVPFETTDVEFLYYLLLTQKSGFISLCGGSTFLEIGKTQLIAYQVRLPSTKVEQTAIAEVLSEMDAELAGLEQRREKTRALKQGMMQELLTGRTRLI